MPAKYEKWITEDGLTLIRGWTRDGLSDCQIAQNCGVSKHTFSAWKDRFPEIRQAVNEGRAPILVKLEEAMYSRCEWRLVEETKEEMIINPDGSKVQKMTRSKRWIPPDTAMTIFVAKNMLAHKFREHPEPVFIEEQESDGLMDALKEQWTNEAMVDDVAMIQDGEDE